MKKNNKKVKLLISVFFFFILFSFSGKVQAETQATTTITGTAPNQNLTISGCSALFGGSTYGYRGYYGGVLVFETGGSGGFPCNSPPFITNIPSAMGIDVNSTGILRFDFYENEDFTGDRFAYFIVVYDGTEWKNGSTGTNFSWATSTTEGGGTGFLQFLDVPELLKTKAPFAYLPYLWGIVTNANTNATTSMATSTLVFTFASGTPQQQIISVDMFSENVFRKYLSQSIIDILRNLMKYALYAGLLLFIYHDLKNRKVL